MSLEQLNRDFGISGQLDFVEGEGDLPFIAIDNGVASALISVYGGQVLSYQPSGASDDVMFLSDQAYFVEGKAIKGGVPICWPWFGADPEDKGRAAHGFARNRMWKVIETEGNDEGLTNVVLGFSDSDETRAIWPHAFDFHLEITVGASLSLALVTHNTGDQPFRITQALHTYFKVGDIAQVKVSGLNGVNYLDKVDDFSQKQQAGDVAVAGEVDRVYTRVQPEQVIEDGALARRINITSAGSRTVVVWNPWAAITAGMADLDDDAYKHFICVETANAADDVIEIAAGEEHRLMATYSVSQD